MKLLDDLAIPDPHPTRRTFLARATAGAITVVSAGVLTVAVRYLWPSVLFELPTRFRALTLSSIGRKVIHVIKDRKLYVVADERGAYAMSAVCTHLGCLTRPDPDGKGFFCPCHGSKYDLNGKVTRGPADKSLPHYRVEVAQNDLWVDTARHEDVDERTPV